MPSNTRLLKASDDVFYLVTQMFTFYAWFRHISPRLLGSKAQKNEVIHFRLVENGIVEAQLMYYRKLNEFFYPAPKTEKYPDDLRAYKFGFTELAPFIDATDMTELHKRVAHPTFEEADKGKRSYEIYATSWRGLHHGIRFLTFVQKSLLLELPEKSKSMESSIKLLRDLWDEWSAAIPQDQRKRLS